MMDSKRQIPATHRSSTVQHETPEDEMNLPLIMPESPEQGDPVVKVEEIEEEEKESPMTSQKSPLDQTLSPK